MALNKISDNNVTNPLTINTLRVDGTFTSSGTGIFTGGTQSTVGLIVRQSQVTTGTDLQQWQQGDGFVWGRVTSQGEFQFGANGSTVRLGTNTGGAAALVVSSTSTAQVGAIIKGSAGITADIFQVQNSSGSVVSSITPTGFLNANSSQYGNSIVWSAPASTTYYLLATLPISSAGTLDHIQIDGIHGGWGSTDFAKSTFLFANRNAFTWKHFLSNRDIMANFKLRAYSQVDGSVQIWASGEASQFLKFAYNISSATNITTVQNPTATTTAPSGTVVFDSSNTTTYPPVETRFGGLSVFGTTAGTVTYTVRGASGQTANVTEWQTWDGTTATTVAYMGSGGGFRATIVQGGAGAETDLRAGSSGGLITTLKTTSAATNPGANYGRLYFRDGTTAGTLKLATRTGASGIEETIVDNLSSTGSTAGAQFVGAGGVNTAGTLTSAGLILSSTTSPITLNGSAGTSGLVLTSAGAGATPTWTNPNLVNVNTTAKSAAYTLGVSDLNTLVQMSGAFAFTVDTNLYNVAVGTQITLLALTSGVTVAVSGAGVVVNATPGLKLRAQYSVATLICLASGPSACTWLLTGDLSA